MDSHKRIVTESVAGTAEMRELTLSVLAALERAGLADLTQTLQDRLLGRATELLHELYEENAVQRCRFKPMVELVLREAKDVAGRTSASLDQRRRAIEWALDMAGF